MNKEKKTCESGCVKSTEVSACLRMRAMREIAHTLGYSNEKLANKRAEHIDTESSQKV